MAALVKEAQAVVANLQKLQASLKVKAQEEKKEEAPAAEEAQEEEAMDKCAGFNLFA
jgi:hypothetical protein